MRNPHPDCHGTINQTLNARQQSDNYGTEGNFLPQIKFRKFFFACSALWLRLMKTFFLIFAKEIFIN